MSDAKDEEITRLRGWLDRVLYKTGCTRGQRTTQWCDEAVEAHKELREARDEIERMKAELLVARKVIDHAYCWTGPTDWQMQKEAWDFLKRHKEAT